MIVDCHTQLIDLNHDGAILSGGPPRLLMETARHLEAVDTVDRAIVLGFKSRYAEAEVSNRVVADYVQQNSTKLVGFAGIDPTDEACLDELATAQDELRLKGVTVSPPLQCFHPTDTRAYRLYEECVRRGMPVVFEQNHRNPASRMEFARPALLDEVASDFPTLKIVVAHMGFPWVDETLVLLGKHSHVFADVSGLLPRRWMSYNALLGAYEYGVMDKLLFGSDFPRRSPAACIEALYSINQMVHGTNLGTIPREQLRGIVERDSLSLLGIESRVVPTRPARSTSLVDDE